MIKIKKCKHCLNDFDLKDKKKGWMANHVRWCHQNPNRGNYKKPGGSLICISAMNSARKRTGITNQFSKAKILGLPPPPGTMTGKPGTFIGRKHSDQTLQKMSESARNSNHRRLRRKMILYNEIWLDSTWELELAKRLDQLNIKWIRPEPILWYDENHLKHNYFPDFYLPDYDKFLDPKNPKACQVQKKKINILLTILPNLHIIKSLEECKNYIH